MARQARRSLDDKVGLSLHRFQVLPVPDNSKLVSALLKLGLAEGGFNESHTLLVNPADPDAEGIFIARLVRE